jgi:hypothetical protein
MAQLFENAQWRVTNGGLEAKSDVPTVYIPADDLLRKRETDADWAYEWPLHLAENSWIDYPAFSEAFNIALKHHEKAFDEVKLARSIAAGAVRAQKLQRQG